MVDGVFSGQDDLGDGDKRVSIPQQRFNNAGQRFRCVQSGVVEQHDGAGLYFGGHPLGDFGGG